MLRTMGKMMFGSWESPKFTLQESKADDYEVRTYHTTNWVSTTVSGMDQDEALSTGFKRLFKYIQGTNEKQVTVDMTAPVTCHINPGAEPACEGSFTVAFYVPEAHQAEPPKPSIPEIFVENRKEFTVFVRTFGGFANAQNSHDEMLKLMESLKRDGKSFKEVPYYRVGYDSPFKLVNRKNEIWLEQEERKE
ncbi:heme-binding protein 2 [Clarias gariepinus]|uniref:heme-binding protein 2 n=1 Tax=Clarias gariepinus TaxID=13013 RepID=UPI00234DE6A2|nr:heme-binding protein 2 [Clarias gariepinus]